jgi:hypothetical protein
MVGLVRQNPIQDPGRLFLAGIGFVGGGRGSDQAQCVEDGRFGIVGVCRGELLHGIAPG